MQEVHCFAVRALARLTLGVNTRVSDSSGVRPACTVPYTVVLVFVLFTKYYNS